MACWRALEDGVHRRHRELPHEEEHDGEGDDPGDQLLGRGEEQVDAGALLGSLLGRQEQRLCE